MVGTLDYMKYPDFTNTKVIVIGDIILDQYFCGNVHRISPEAPVPIVTINQKTTNLGGAGNVVMNLKGMGCGHTLMGVIGDDFNGIVLSDILNKEKIQYNIITVHRHPTITKTRVISQGQQIVRLDEEEVSMMNDEYRIKLLSRFDECLSDTTGVIISDYGKGLIDSIVTKHVITKCNSKEIPVFVDPKGTSWKRYSGAFCITPNMVEFNLIEPFVEDEPTLLYEKSKIVMDKYNFENILLTRGSEGMVLFNKHHPPICIQAESKEVFDVSGAGDTVIAFMAAGFGSGMDLEKSAEIANIAAGVVIGKQGTKPINQFELEQSLSKDDISKVVDKHQALQKIKEWRKSGDTIVFTNGCFDIIHIGHIRLLHEASLLGDRLIIGLNSDISIKRLKGENRPVVNEKGRSGVLSYIEGVDMVVIFDEETPIDLINLFEPDVIVKGGDHKSETVIGKDVVKEVIIIPLVDGNSTTNVIETIKEKG